MSNHDDVRVCTPPRSWLLNDGTTIRHGSRVYHRHTGAGGVVEHFAGPGWAEVRYDDGGQALTDWRELTTEPPPTCQGSAPMYGFAAVELDREQRLKGTT